MKTWPAVLTVLIVAAIMTAGVILVATNNPGMVRLR